MPTYAIKTFGCQMNFSDSERLITFLKENGFSPLDDTTDSKLKTEEIINADLIIFNTCGVRASAENRVFGQINNILTLAEQKNKRPKILITGCSAHRPDFQKVLKGKADIFTSIKNFPQALKKLNLLDTEVKEYRDYLAIQPQYKYQDSVFVPIMTGCNNFCSYCVVPYARGREWSRPWSEIVQELSRLTDCQEVTLLGQNVNSYAGQISSEELSTEPELQAGLKYHRPSSKAKISSPQLTITFPVLLAALAQKFPRLNFKFLTSHPKDLSPELIAVIKKFPNIPNEIHLPLQSGSNKVLKDMNRPYTQEHYLDLITEIRRTIPKIKITTDVIIGFPTETEEDFRETVKVFHQAKFADAFLNKYSPRPGTKAYSLGDPIPWKVKKEREKKLREILSS